MGMWEMMESMGGMVGSSINPMVRIASKPLFWGIVIAFIMIVFGVFIFYPFVKWIFVKILCLLYTGGFSCGL